MKYEVSTDYGDCTVEAATPSKAKYQAYLKWCEAFRPNGWTRRPFMDFIGTVNYVVPMGT